jgi:hypothetical protein
LVLGVAGLLPAVLPSGSVRADDGFSSGPAPEWVRIQPVPAAWPSESSANGGANWRIWLLDAQVDRRGGEAVAFYEQVAEARTRELVGELARFSIPFNPEFQSLTIHDVEVRRDGEWVTRFDPQRVTLARREAAFEADIATGVMSALIVVDDVRPGDLVRYRYSVRGENPVLAGMLHDEFRMTWHDPILRRHVRVLFPRGAEVDVRPFGIEAEPVVRSKRDGTEVVLLLENAPVVKVAGDLPAWYDAYASVQIGPRRNWSEVVAWALPLYPEGQPLPDELEQRIAQWRSLPDAQARAAAALEAVQDEVRYFSVLLGESSHRPSAPSQTWLRRFGDCKDKAWLLAVLLRRLDVDAVPALVSSGGNRRIAEGIPAASQFDHAIVRARIDDRTYWLDPTLTLQRGTLSDRSAFDFGVALPVAAGVGALEAVSGDVTATWAQKVQERFEPSADGTRIELTVDTVRSGRMAERIRRELERQGEAELASGYANHYRRLYGELEVLSPLQVEHVEADGSVRLRERYALLSPWEPSPAGRRLIDLYADGVADPIELPADPVRGHPLALRHPVKLEQVTEFVLPPGWRLHALPEAEQVEDDAFSYRREVSELAGRIVVRHAYASRADHVTAAAIPQHVAQRRQANGALGFRLALAMAASQAQGDRQERMRRLVRDLLEAGEGGQ